MTAARSLRSPAQRLSLSSRRSRRRLWSFSVSSEPTFLRKFGSWHGGDRVLDPGLGGQHLGCGLVLFGGQRRRQRGQADARGGRGLGEERLDLARAGAAVEQRLLGALVEALAVGPGRVGLHEGADLGGSAVAAPVQVPVDQLAPGGVGDLVAQRLALGQVGFGDGLDRIANAAASSALTGRLRVCGDGGVVAGGMLHLLRRRPRRGAGLGGRCRRGSGAQPVVAAAFCLASAGLAWAGLGCAGLGRADLRGAPSSRRRLLRRHRRRATRMRRPRPGRANSLSGACITSHLLIMHCGCQVRRDSRRAPHDPAKAASP